VAREPASTTAMDTLTAPPDPARLQQQHHHHHRPSSRNTSVSSSSVVTVTRAPSPTRNAPSHADLAPTPLPQRASPPPHDRRRSSAAHGAADGIGLFREGTANINRWSQSTTSSRSSQPREKPAGPLSALTNTLHGAAPRPASPSRRNQSPAPASSAFAASPRRVRPRSPVHEPPSMVAAAPRIPSLPPILLSATVYDPNTPTSASTTNSPSTSDLFTPSALAFDQPRDYFNSRPQLPPPISQRPASRSKADRVLGKSPLGSPAIIGVQEGDARHDTTAGATRAPGSRRPSVPATRESVQKPPQSAGHRQAPSRDHSRNPSRDYHRSGSRDHSRSTSKDHSRSESNTSARVDDYQGTPPRNRERREKDKKTMLSRALQKANTAVLLDNAQNFEGAMEAYEDACKLLQQVMIRSSQEEDRRKLDAIVSAWKPGHEPPLVLT
jgi:hypothetical protein